jgi:hypothetical protein
MIITTIHLRKLCFQMRRLNLDISASVAEGDVFYAHLRDVDVPRPISAMADQ